MHWLCVATKRVWSAFSRLYPAVATVPIWLFVPLLTQSDPESMHWLCAATKRVWSTFCFVYPAVATVPIWLLVPLLTQADPENIYWVCVATKRQDHLAKHVECVAMDCKQILLDAICWLDIAWLLQHSFLSNTLLGKLWSLASRYLQMQSTASRTASAYLKTSRQTPDPT